MKQHKKYITGRMIVGIMFISLGALLMIDKLDIYYFEWHWSYWPIIFVVIGLTKIGNANHSEDVSDGVWWMFLGSWLFICINHVWGLSFHTFWPAIIIAVGLKMIWKSLLPKRQYSVEIFS